MSVIELRPTPVGAAFGSPGHAVHSELRNTAEYFIEQRAKFNLADAELFEQSAPPDYSAKNSLLNGTPENQTWPPIFAKFVHYKEAPLPFPFSPLFENDDFMIVLNGADPYTAVYPPHEEGRAGMSFVHLLVLPKKRHIYNAVSLRATDIPLLEAMASGVRQFVTDAANRNAIASRIKAQLGRNAMFKDNLEMLELLEADIAAYVADDDAPNELEFYFHVHPNHSVGYLHMHAIARNMRANSTTSHDNKNTPLKVIIDVLENPVVSPIVVTESGLKQYRQNNIDVRWVTQRSTPELRRIMDELLDVQRKAIAEHRFDASAKLRELIYKEIKKREWSGEA